MGRLTALDHMAATGHCGDLGGRAHAWTWLATRMQQSLVCTGCQLAREASKGVVSSILMTTTGTEAWCILAA